MNNQTPNTTCFDWNPSLSDLRDELTQIVDKIEPVYCCLAQGFATTLLQYIPLSRVADILCNPSLPTKDIRFIKLLSLFLWSSNKSSSWFSGLIEASWREQMPWPLEGSAPWISRSLSEQKLYPMALSNGTWKQMLTCILDSHREGSSRNIVVFLGSESPAVSNTSPTQILDHFSDCPVKYRVFSGLRQELLLAESVQRDILQVCEEFL